MALILIILGMLIYMAVALISASFHVYEIPENFCPARLFIVIQCHANAACIILKKKCHRDEATTLKYSGCVYFSRLRELRK